MSAVIPAHGSLPSPRLFRQPGQGDAASKPPHLPLTHSETRAIALCSQLTLLVIKWSCTCHQQPPSSRQHAVKRVEQDRLNGCTTVINHRISANLRACCRQKVASRQGKIPGARQEMLGGRENGANSSPNHARLTPSPAKLSAFADKILKNQKSLI